MVVNVFQTYALAPIVYRGAIQMHPALLIALPIGAAMAGAVGLFLAVPAVAFGLAVAGPLIDAIGTDVADAQGERARSCRCGWTASRSGAGGS